MTKNHILNVIRNDNTALCKNYEIVQGTPAYEDTLVDSLEKKELMSIFYKAVDMLPPQKREICLMKVREELSNQEIADALKMQSIQSKTLNFFSKLLRVHLGKLLIFVTYLTLLGYLSVYYNSNEYCMASCHGHRTQLRYAFRSLVTPSGSNLP